MWCHDNNRDIVNVVAGTSNGWFTLRVLYLLQSVGSNSWHATAKPEFLAGMELIVKSFRKNYWIKENLVHWTVRYSSTGHASLSHSPGMKMNVKEKRKMTTCRTEPHKLENHLKNRPLSLSPLFSSLSVTKASHETLVKSEQQVQNRALACALVGSQLWP